MVRIQLLGSFELHDPQRKLIKLPTRKVEALLAYLILQRREPQARERLAGLFWGESPEDKARLSLRAALHALHKALEPEPDQKGKYLLLTRTTVQLNPQALCWVDLVHFEKLLEEADALKGPERARALQEAIALYRGDLLQGCYDEWCLEARDRLNDLHLKALQELVVHHAERKEFDQAIPFAKELLAKNPLQEEVHRQLIYLYFAKGERAAALEQYRACQKILKDELGVEPLPETQALYREIEARVSVSAPEAERVQAAMARELLRRYPELGALFVGRVEELAQLAAVWEATRAGQGQILCVRGEAGVGKTRLVQELAHYVRKAGGRTLTGRCYELEARMPFHPWVETLRTELGQTAFAELEQVSPLWLAQVAKLIPELGEQLPKTQMASPLLTPEQERQRLFEGLTQTLLSLAHQRPLLLCLDDLQWADESSLQFIHYLARRISQEPLLLMGVYRTGEVDEDHPLVEVLQQLQRDERVKFIELFALSREEVRELVTGALRLEEPERNATIEGLIERIARDSKGNPFFAVELLKSFIESGVLYLEEAQNWQIDRTKLAAETIPKTVRAVVQMRLRRVSHRSRELLSFVATAGRAFEAPLLGQASGQRPEDLLSSIEELLKRSLLIEEGARYNFSHELIRQAIYAGLSTERRRGLHLQVARTLEAVHAQRPDGNGIVGEIAKHFYQSGEWERALSYALLAGKRAWASYAKREAVDFYQMALELAEKLENTQALMEAYKGLAEACCYTDKLDEGIEYGLKALELCPDPEKRAEIYCAIANAHQGKRQVDWAWQYCEQALRELGPDNQSTAAVRTYYQASSFLNWLFRYDEAIEYCQRGLRILENAKDESILALIYGTLAQAHMGKRDYKDAIKYAARAAKLAEKTGDVYSIVDTCFGLALAHYESGNVDAAIDAWKKSLAASERMEAQRNIGIIYDRIVFAYMRKGEIDHALHHAEKLREIQTELGDRREIAVADGILGCLYEAKRWTTKAEDAFQKAIEGAGEHWALYTSLILAYALLDKNEIAIKWLERGRVYLEERHFKMLQTASSFDRLRQEPRFRALVDGER